MADYLIRARVVERKRILGRTRFAASVSAIPLKSDLPAIDVAEELCESREAAHVASERMIGALSQELSRRGDRVLGVKIDHQHRPRSGFAHPSDGNLA